MSEFAFVGRYAIYNVDFAVTDGSGMTAAADSPPIASFRNYATDAEIFQRPTASTADLGVYRLTLSSLETATAGLYYILWGYDLDGIAQQYRTDIEIASSQSSAYETLDGTARMIVETTWLRFEDMFDSAIGGPHLKEYAQSSFGRDRLAQLLGLAINRLNVASQPHQAYTLESFPYVQWGGLLEWALYLETIRHLIRSYAEQPDAQGVQTARLDRSRYSEIWRGILRDEEPQFTKAVEQYKFAAMGLGRASVLVSGGIFGEWTRPMPNTRPKMMPPVGWWR